MLAVWEMGRCLVWGGAARAGVTVPEFPFPHLLAHGTLAADVLGDPCSEYWSLVSHTATDRLPVDEVESVRSEYAFVVEMRLDWTSKTAR